jgi:hypothetical protein
VKPAKKTARIPALTGAIDGLGHWAGEHVGVAAGAMSQHSRWCGHLVHVSVLAGSARLWATGCAQLVQEITAPKLCHRGIDGLADTARDDRCLTPRRHWAARSDQVREPGRGLRGGTDRCCTAIRRRKPAPRVPVSCWRSVVAFHPSHFPNEGSRGHTSTESPTA